jgi:hypothetical protein
MNLDEIPPLQLVDIRGYSFDQFVAFVFDREIASDSSRSWYWQIDVSFDPQTLCGYYTQLFRQPEFLRDLYSVDQLEQGVWALQSYCDFSVQRIFWDEELDFEQRAQLVRAMFELFAALFSHEPLDSAVSMWWDSLCYDWHCKNRMREKGGEDLLMQDVMFETLSRILWLNSELCRGAALHGLGHLHHPLTENLISEFLAKNPNVSNAMRSYAIAASKFEVM